MTSFISHHSALPGFRHHQARTWNTIPLGRGKSALQLLGMRATFAEAKKCSLSVGRLERRAASNQLLLCGHSQRPMAGRLLCWEQSPGFEPQHELVVKDNNPRHKPSHRLSSTSSLSHCHCLVTLPPHQTNAWRSPVTQGKCNHAAAERFRGCVLVCCSWRRADLGPRALGLNAGMLE